MGPTCDAIQELADRIERAYLRRRPGWRAGCSNARVWSAAAGVLMGLHQDDPSIPIDPVLFVAAQPAASPVDDPWEVLTQSSSGCYYRRLIRQIVRKLRHELRGEVRRAERRLRAGEAIEAALGSGADRLSPLGRIIVATRAGRPDLSAPWRDAARGQHRACPLYRQACRGLLPAETYPADIPASNLIRARRPAPAALQFSVN